MYYVPEGTKTCGYYECKKCGNRFLSMQTMSRIPCPDCAAEIDYEIGPDETMLYCSLSSVVPLCGTHRRVLYFI